MAEADGETLARRMPAYALLRAAVAQDQDTLVLIVMEAYKAGTLDHLVFNVVHLAARAMLGAEGWDVPRVLRVIDEWMLQAVSGAGPERAT